MGSVLQKTLNFQYNHVSLYLSHTKKIYSFARLSYHIPFVAGFVEENLNCLMYPEDSVDVRVFQIPLNDTQYNQLASHIDEFTRLKDQYLYNLFVPVEMAFNTNFNIHKSFTCSSFTAYLLDSIGVINLEALDKNPNLITPKDLNFILNKYFMADTTLYKENCVLMNDEVYFRKPAHIVRAKRTAKYIFRLAQRIT